jgi:hypothetical protein
VENGLAYYDTKLFSAVKVLLYKCSLAAAVIVT